MTDWMFQANPKRYDLVAEAAKGFSDDWSMNQHRDVVAVGDRIFFFLSGSKAGIYALGRVVSPVYEATEPDEFGRWKVDVEYEAFVSPPLLRAELLSDTTLAGYRPFGGLLRTNFVVPPEVSQRLDELLVDRTMPIDKPAGKGFDATIHSVDKAIAQHQDEVRQQLLDYLRQMPPGQFEDVIRLLLESLGYEDAVVTGQSGDGGVDVRATLRLHGMTSVPTVVQAKRWANNVGGDVVQQLRGALHVDERGVVITTSSFTKAAQAEAVAVGKSPIGIVDGTTLVNLLIERGIGVKKRSLSIWRLDPDSLASPLPAGGDDD
jgi:HJR/Mrr/RecB family endonuclease